MRCFAFFALASATIFGTSSALVDAGERTTVSVTANGYDTRTSASGCSPSGCIPANTRDGSTADNSRWSCKEDLVGENCEICYDFGDAQDIVSVSIAFYNGDQYTRTLKVRLNGSTWGTIVSSGTTSSYQSFALNTDETDTLCLESLKLDGDEWISITEVQIMVV